jgi:hypothetical protein
MNREDIIRMAREAGLTGLMEGGLIDYFERFAAIVAAAEREVCARETDIAYRERNQLVALLTILFPSGKAKTTIEGWDEAWNGCVYIDFPWGQASWHYHRDDEAMFAHLMPYTKGWDGHTTDEKYSKIAAEIRARGQE